MGSFLSIAVKKVNLILQGDPDKNDLDIKAGEDFQDAFRESISLTELLFPLNYIEKVGKTELTME